jgi:hypothetical protein
MYEGLEVLEEGIFSNLAHVKEKKSDKNLKEVQVVGEFTKGIPRGITKAITLSTNRNFM